MRRVVRSLRLLVLGVLLLLHAPARVVRAHIYSWIFDFEKVCDPDFFQCPNGGLAFRDRKHHCAFAPCSLIPQPPLPPPPPDPKTLSETEWFGHREFLVPSFDVTAIQRGKALAREWAAALAAKQERPPLSTFSLTVDLYVVPNPVPARSPREAYARNAHQLHLDALLASEVALHVVDTHAPSGSGDGVKEASPTAQMLAVSHRPWTRWEFFGHLASGDFAPTVNNVQAALKLLKNSTTAASSSSSTSIPGEPSKFVALVVEGSSDAAYDPHVMGELLTQCESVLTDAGSVSYTASDKDQSHRKLLAAAGDKANTSVLVFSTNFGATAVATSEQQRPWNVSLVDCEKQAVDAVAPQLREASVANSSASYYQVINGSTHLLVHPDGVSLENDVGHSSDDQRGVRCSCWKRSLGSDAGSGSSSNATADSKWVLCR